MTETTETFERRCRHCGTAASAGFEFCSKCGASLELREPQGDPLLGMLRDLFGRDLEFERELGRGGMAAVYSAFDPVLERRVAVKSILPEIAEDTEIVARFLSEARTVASLQHPNVVSVYSVRAGDGVSAIVMQFVEGRSLDVVLRERSPLPIAVGGLLLTQIAAGLQHAHERGVVHRDVKPANVLIDRQGNAVVSDFGIARRDGTTRITGTGVVVGTMAYMSPEQRNADTAGPSSDQYAFGVMAFELLAGRLPFVGTLEQTHYAHLITPPPSLREFRPDIPRAIESLVLRMLEKDPAARYPNLREVERIFRPLIPDPHATTLVVAEYSREPEASGSKIARAIPVAPVSIDAVPRSAAVESVATSERVARAESAAVESKTDRPSVITGARVAIAAIVVILLAGSLVWRAARSAAPRPAPVQLSSAPAAGEDGKPVPAVRGQPQSVNGFRSTVASPGGTGSAVAPPAAGARSGASEPSAKSLSTFPAADSASARDVAKPATGAGGGIAAASTDVAPSHASLPVSAAATTADARAVAREFVTMLNQRRWKELDQLGALAGDAALRAEIVRLTHNAQDYAAGFDRVASSPEANGDGFLTECVVALEWRGGHRLVLVQLRGVAQNGTWHLAAFGAVPED